MTLRMIGLRKDVIMTPAAITMFSHLGLVWDPLLNISPGLLMARWRLLIKRGNTIVTPELRITTDVNLSGKLLTPASPPTAINMVIMRKTSVNTSQ